MSKSEDAKEQTSGGASDSGWVGGGFHLSLLVVKDRHLNCSLILV